MFVESPRNSPSPRTPRMGRCCVSTFQENSSRRPLRFRLVVEIECLLYDVVSVYRECRPRSEFVQRAFRRSAGRLVRLDRNVRWAGMPYVRREVSHTNSREAAGTSQSRASQPCEGTMATGRARPWPKEARLHASQGNENGKLIFSSSDPKQAGSPSSRPAD